SRSPIRSTDEAWRSGRKGTSPAERLTWPPRNRSSRKLPRSSPSSASDLPTPEKPYAAFREFLLREAAPWMGRSGRAAPPHQPEADHPHRHHRQRRGFGHRGWVNRLAHRSELSQRQGEATGGLGAPADHVEGGDVRGGDRVLD